MPFGHAAGYVLTCDASGVGTWQSVSATAWGLTGNAGTTPGTNFLGTTDNQALEVHVNSTRALRIEPNATSPNVIGGYSGNSVTAGVSGAFVGGGGESGNVNAVNGNNGAVVGGRDNVVQGAHGFVGGGMGNAASGLCVVAGGSDNTASGTYATVGGGQANRATDTSATVGGGWNNDADGRRSTISGGIHNWTLGDVSTIPGGDSNWAFGMFSFAAGVRAKARHDGTFVWNCSPLYNLDSDAADQFLARALGGFGFYCSSTGDGLRLLPHGTSPNLIGGYNGNTVTSGVHGAFIGGGGALAEVNTVTGHYGTISGGLGHTGGGEYSTIGGGWDNTASQVEATVGGGGGNLAGADDATVAGGADNTASGVSSVVGGGELNVASGAHATIPGGLSNAASGDYSFAAGRRAKANHQGAFVWADSTDADFASGAANQFLVRSTAGVAFYVTTNEDGLRIASDATSPNILGGHHSNGFLPGAYGCTVGGGGTTGNPNLVTDPYCTVGGGIGNQAGDGDGDFSIDDADSATVSGGWGNSATNCCATVSGGDENTASGDSSTVSGGESNTGSGKMSTIGGGSTNACVGDYATVGGGTSNQANDEGDTVGGGASNIANGDYATVGGGFDNTAMGSRATIGGGDSNTAAGLYATAPGGRTNSAAGNYSFAAGRRAKANNSGAFVWGDSTDADVVSGAANQFVARASGGFYFYTNAAASTGSILSAGSGTWASMSDRNVKKGFTPVDPKGVLAKLAAVPISTWSYKSEGGVRHMGPMAQDLHAAFGLGDSNRSICTIDGDGISMAAIQGLYQLGREKDARIDGQAATIKGLEKKLSEKGERIDALEQRLSKVEAALEGLRK